MSGPISECEIERFSRQMVLTGWGGREQAKLKALTVAVEGRYFSAAIYLAAAGVGRLILIDPVLRQSDPAVAHITELNPGTKVELVKDRADLAVRDLVLIGTDWLTGPLNSSIARPLSGADSPSSNPLTLRGILIEPGTKCGSTKLIPVSVSTKGLNSMEPGIELTFPPLLSPDLFAGAAAASAVIKTVLCRAN